MTSTEFLGNRLIEIITPVFWGDGYRLNVGDRIHAAIYRDPMGTYAMSLDGQSIVARNWREVTALELLAEAADET